jgi:hypothetical protein
VRPRSSLRPDRADIARCLTVAVFLIIGLAPGSSSAATCDELAGRTVQIAGTYVPVEKAYARTFVFAMLLDCGGTKEVVTVQRSTGNLPVCQARQQVDVVGTLIWNKALVDGHFEINDPSSVVCRATAPVATKETAQRQPAPAVPRPGSPAGAESPPAQIKAVGSSVWIGRYHDSRGVGDVILTLVRGESTVSGTWKLRTGGGGPLTGLLEPGGLRMLLRMENIAPECPGTFEGSADVTDTTLVATYHGKDCQGGVTEGRLELRKQ